jgi:hypothetical protein
MFFIAKESRFSFRFLTDSGAGAGIRVISSGSCAISQPHAVWKWSIAKKSRRQQPAFRNQKWDLKADSEIQIRKLKAESESESETGF